MVKWRKNIVPYRQLHARLGLNGVHGVAALITRKPELDSVSNLARDFDFFFV